MEKENATWKRSLNSPNQFKYSEMMSSEASKDDVLLPQIMTKFYDWILIENLDKHTPTTELWKAMDLDIDPTIVRKAMDDAFHLKTSRRAAVVFSTYKRARNAVFYLNGKRIFGRQIEVKNLGDFLDYIGELETKLVLDVLRTQKFESTEMAIYVHSELPTDSDYLERTFGKYGAIKTIIMDPEEKICEIVYHFFVGAFSAYSDILDHNRKICGIHVEMLADPLSIVEVLEEHFHDSLMNARTDPNFYGS